MDDYHEFVSERKAFERVSARSEEYNIRTPEGMFMYALSENFELLRDILGLNDTDKTNILKLAAVVQKPGLKNPPSFIYGYVVMKHGRISSSTLTSLSSKLQFGVTLPDVLRYARLLSSYSR